MKKILFMVLLIIGITSFQVLAEEGEQAVPMYEVSGAEFNRMLISDNSCCFDYNMPIAEYFETVNGNVTYKRIKNEKITDFYTNSGIENGYNDCRKGVVFDADFVKLINSKEKMEVLLQKAGSNVAVRRWCLIAAEHDMYADNFPLTIYIEDNNNTSYFVTVETLSEQSNLTKPTDTIDRCENLEFNVFNKNDYYTKFGIKSAVLTIENAGRTLTSNINIQKSEIYVPLRTLLEQLGSKVIWHPEDESVEFGVNNAMYRFYLKGATRICKQNTSNMELVEQWWGYNGDIVNDRIIINGQIVKTIAQMFNKKVEIDYDHLIVTIK